MFDVVFIVFGMQKASEQCEVFVEVETDGGKVLLGDNLTRLKHFEGSYKFWGNLWEFDILQDLNRKFARLEEMFINDVRVAQCGEF